MTSPILQETGEIPVCPKCHAHHFPNESCKSSTEDTVPLCSLCVGNHPTTECPVLDPSQPWEQPELKAKKKRRPRGRRR